MHLDQSAEQFSGHVITVHSILEKHVQKLAKWLIQACKTMVSLLWRTEISDYP